jgi:hypothetical protein
MADMLPKHSTCCFDGSIINIAYSESHNRMQQHRHTQTGTTLAELRTTVINASSGFEANTREAETVRPWCSSLSADEQLSCSIFEENARRLLRCSASTWWPPLTSATDSFQGVKADTSSKEGPPIRSIHLMKIDKSWSANFIRLASTKNILIL